MKLYIEMNNGTISTINHDKDLAEGIGSLGLDKKYQDKVDRFLKTKAENTLCAKYGTCRYSNNKKTLIVDIDLDDEYILDYFHLAMQFITPIVGVINTAKGMYYMLKSAFTGLSTQAAELSNKYKSEAVEYVIYYTKLFDHNIKILAEYDEFNQVIAATASSMDAGWELPMDLYHIVMDQIFGKNLGKVTGVTVVQSFTHKASADMLFSNNGKIIDTINVAANDAVNESSDATSEESAK